MELEISQFVAAISVVISVVAMILAYYRAAKDDVKLLEHRLTNLEENKFTKADRTRLDEVCMKVSLFWTMVEKEFPKILRQPHTRALDALLQRAEAVGIARLNKEEVHKLLDLLETERCSARDNKDTTREFAIALYMTVLRYENGLPCGVGDTR